MEITKGATKNKVLDMTENVEVTGGNHVNPQITTNGFTFIHDGGVLRAPVIDGSRNPAEWGANVIINGVLHLTWEERAPLQLAVDILAAIDTRGGEEERHAWFRALDEIYADPAIDYATMVANVEAWAATDPGGGYAVTNVVDIARAFKQLQGRFFSGQTFNQIKTTLLTYPRETWDGEPTEVGEAYP